MRRVQVYCAIERLGRHGARRRNLFNKSGSHLPPSLPRLAVYTTLTSLWTLARPTMTLATPSYSYLSIYMEGNTVRIPLPRRTIQGPTPYDVSVGPLRPPWGAFPYSLSLASFRGFLPP